MTSPGTPPATADGAPAADDVLVAGPADMHAPGQPPGGVGPIRPNIVAAFPRNPVPTAEVGETPEPSAAPAAGDDPAPDDAATQYTDAPAANAHKAEWVDHAVIAHGVDRASAEAMTKQQLVEQTARQCGPCTFGLPAIAADLTQLTTGRADPAALDQLTRRLEAITGRGACAHPDGAVRLARSALDTFTADLHAHRQGRPCRGAAHPFPLPGLHPPPPTYPARLR